MPASCSRWKACPTSPTRSGSRKATIGFSRASMRAASTVPRAVPRWCTNTPSSRITGASGTWRWKAAMSNERPRSSLTPLYFVLTFIAGAAGGSWALWLYLIGFPSSESLPAPAAAGAAAPAPQAQAQPEPESQPPATPTPTPKGHWNTVDIPGRSHEECLALTKELNDAYKDCRFGVHKEVWVEE